METEHVNLTPNNSRPLYWPSWEWNKGDLSWHLNHQRSILLCPSSWDENMVTWPDIVIIKVNVYCANHLEDKNMETWPDILNHQGQTRSISTVLVLMGWKHGDSTWYLDHQGYLNYQTSYPVCWSSRGWKHEDLASFFNTFFFFFF